MECKELEMLKRQVQIQGDEILLMNRKINALQNSIAEMYDDLYNDSDEDEMPPIDEMFEKIMPDIMKAIEDGRIKVTKVNVPKPEAKQTSKKSPEKEASNKKK